MPIKRYKRKKEEIKHIRENINKNIEDLNDNMPAIVKDTGGSIGNLDIKTPEFKKWVTDLQKLKNPFIGKKYLQKAPEYSIEDKIIEEDKKVENFSDSFKKILEEGTKEYNPNEDHSDVSENLTNGPKAENTHDTDFIDISIIENLTRAMADMEDDIIVKESKEQIKKYHDDENYKISISIENVIENTKKMLLLENNSKKYIDK